MRYDITGVQGRVEMVMVLRLRKVGISGGMMALYKLLNLKIAIREME